MEEIFSNETEKKLLVDISSHCYKLKEKLVVHKEEDGKIKSNFQHYSNWGNKFVGVT